MNLLGKRRITLKQKRDRIEFDLNETLYVENGQEIEEMIAISLDPDIAVQTYDSYIQVRGLIILQGEYKKANQESVSNTLSTENVNGLIERVIESENNQVQFSHRFPVEISVPTNRVDNLEDITVTVDSFDYELPDELRLKINASVHINGIKTEVEDKQSQKKDVDFEVEDKIGTDEIQSKQRTPKDFEEEVTKDEDSVTAFEPSNVTDKQEKSVAAKTEDQISEETFKQEKKIDVEGEGQTVEEMIENTAESEEVTHEQMQGEFETHTDKERERIEQKETDPVSVEDVERHEGTAKEVAEDQIIEQNEIDIQLNESAEDEDEDDVKDVLFLTDLFGGEEEDTYTKMRIYITQSDDTIESIAKRYEISTLQLIKDNDLNGTTLEEGQLLRIPVHIIE